MPERSLFGGAVTCDIPANWADVSDVRQVPDHQECFQELGPDRLLVVEMIGYESQVPNAQAAKYFYDDLAEANGITSDQYVSFSDEGQLVQVAGLPNDASQCFGAGFQKVAMGSDTDIWGNPRQQEIRLIRVELCVLRLPSVQTDILVTLSSPSEPNPQDSTVASLQPTDTFQRVLSTFLIRDWSLFG